VYCFVRTLLSHSDSAFDRICGVVVSVLATGPKGSGFKNPAKVMDFYGR
jgi:hypothetical protein